MHTWGTGCHLDAVMEVLAESFGLDLGHTPDSVALDLEDPRAALPPGEAQRLEIIYYSDIAIFTRVKTNNCIVKTYGPKTIIVL